MNEDTVREVKVGDLQSNVDLWAKMFNTDLPGKIKRNVTLLQFMIDRQTFGQPSLERTQQILILIRIVEADVALLKKAIHEGAQS